jgi:CheY-like chemotaxis protein
MKNSSPCVLCVDDDPLNLSLLDAMLTGRGFEAIKAGSGREALETIGNQAIDVVLLDVMMPGMDGFEVCRRIKSDERCRNIPVIMITAYADKENRIRGIEAGAEDFISKPFDAAEVMARVNMLLRVKVLNDQLNSAYNNITNLTAFGERILDSFNPLHFNFLKTVTDIVSQIIATSPEMRDRPQVVLVHIPEGTEDGRWFRFESPGAVLSMTSLSSELGRHFPRPTGKESCMLFFNKEDLARPETGPLVDNLAQTAVAPVNLVCYLCERIRCAP